MTKKEISELRSLSQLSSIHKFKTTIENYDSKRFQELWLSRQLLNYHKIKNFFQQNNVKHLLLPGGVYGNSGLIKLAQKADTLISSYDSGRKRALFSLYGIAGYQDDVNKILNSNEFKNMNLDEIKTVNTLVENELNARINGIDSYKTQVVSSSRNNSEKYDILMPLNITWDLPALGRHIAFKNDFEWIKETVEFILHNTDANLAIRQHPHERNHTSGKDLKEFILNKYKDNKRLKFISANDKVNSYNLLGNAKIILPYVSTIGIEAAILGKTVILESDNYYSEKSFVIKCIDKNSYFKTIKRNLVKQEVVSLNAIQEAKFTYYVSQICTTEITNFTPFNEDFEIWSKY